MVFPISPAEAIKSIRSSAIKPDMGRKKQKVRWTTVEDGFFDPNQLPEDPNQLPDSQVVYFQHQHHQQHQPQRHNSESSMTSNHSMRTYRKYGPGPPRRSWVNPTLAPRFERSKVGAGGVGAGGLTSASAGAPDFNDADSSCEAEDLPNGFTKIRSKNLDVLFRKDYYAQRMLLQQNSGATTTGSSSVSSEQGDSCPLSHPEAEADPQAVINIEEAVDEIEEQTTNKTAAETTAIIVKKSTINSNATPFYPSYLTSRDTPPSYITAPPISTSSRGARPPSNARPNLFLYSPTSNTIIPCEEIIMPNHGMGSSSAEVYHQGTTNIYLAFPMDQGGSGPAATPLTGPSAASKSPPPPAAAQSPTTNNMVQQASSTYNSVTPPYNPAATPPGPGYNTATPPTHHIVQYDQYGVPYTSYTPVHHQGGVGNSDGGVASTSAESSSADSTQPHSPPDLSAYNPTNWVAADPNYAGGAGGAPPMYSQQHYYQQYYQPTAQQFYSGGGGGLAPSYQQYLHMETSTVPSSAGESPNEDRSEGEDNTTTPPTTATTTTSNSPKKEVKDPALQGQVGVKVTIPGLPVNTDTGPKRPTKKRRKKKTTLSVLMPTTPTTDHLDHRGSSSSEAAEAAVKNNNVLQMAAAITILQRRESLNNEVINKTALDNVDEALVVEKDVVDEPIVVGHEVVTVGHKEVVDEVPVRTRQNRRRRGARKSDRNKKIAQLAELQESENVKREIVEENLVKTDDVKITAEVINKTNVKTTAEVKNDQIKTVVVKNNNIVVMSEAKTKVVSKDKTEVVSSQAAVEVVNILRKYEKVNNITEVKPKVKTEPVKIMEQQDQQMQDQWEVVPKDLIKETNDGGEWETSRKSRKSRKFLGETTIEVSHCLAEDFEIPPTDQKSTTIPEVVITTSTIEAFPDKTQETKELQQLLLKSEFEPPIEVNSAPTSRKSTLKRPNNRKKRGSLDYSGADNNSSSSTGSQLIKGAGLSRPVLISDSDFDVTSAAASRRFKCAFEVFDEATIRELASNTEYDTLYVSDIGYGMSGGPIHMDRFGLGKYLPPDRTDEIYPIPMQQEQSDLVTVNGDAAAAEKSDADDAETEKKSSIHGESCQSDQQKAIIKAMMDEVMKNNSAATANTTAADKFTCIRDAERFSEVIIPTPKSTNCVENLHDDLLLNNGGVPIPDAIIAGKLQKIAAIATIATNAAETTELDLD
jgi:hypothetical protein